MKSVGIIGLGKALPSKKVTNNDIVEMGLDTSNEWIVSRTGIETRYVAGDYTATSDLAYEAAKNAIEDAKIDAQSIDLIIVATTSQDNPGFPSTACILQNKLNLPFVGAFDLAAACTGFNYALTTAEQFVKTGQAKHVLVVGADCLSKMIDWTDRSICVLFGDGAGAVIVSEVEEGYGLLASELHANGGEAEILKVEAGGSRKPLTPELVENKEHLIYMDGRAVFKVAVNSIITSIEKALEKADIKKEEINMLIMHQANLRIIEYVRDKLGLTPEQVFTTIQKYGNTSASSIPIALTEADKEGKLNKGDNILLVGFGAGFTWGSNIMKWNRA